MKASFRQAIIKDAAHVFELRRRSILELAPRGMSVAQAEKWAANLTLEQMEQRIRETELWIAEADDAIVGWVAIRGDYLDGPYTGEGKFASFHQGLLSWRKEFSLNKAGTGDR